MSVQELCCWLSQLADRELHILTQGAPPLGQLPPHWVTRWAVERVTPQEAK
jgi:hypothetical protein